jgi:hypothetical protein
MRRTRLLLFFCSFIVLASCSTTEVINIWEDSSRPHEFSNILVVAVLKEPAYRRIIEDKMVNVLKEMGVQALASVDSLSNAELINESAAAEVISNAGADGIMVMRLVDTREETVYTPGSTYVRGGYGDRYNRGWHGYYGGGYSVMSTPGYTTEYNISTVETTLFNVATNERAWSTITKTTETSVISAIDSYIKAIAKPLKDGNLFKTP